MNRSFRVLAAFALTLSACNDDVSEAATNDGSDTATETGDGDGDTMEAGTLDTGDGDGDSATGDGDGDSATGDGDGDTATGDGDGDTMGDGDGDTATGDGDGDTMGDGDGDGDTMGDGDGDTMGDGDGDTMGDGDGDGDGVCENGCGNPNCGPCPEGPDPVDVGPFSVDATEVSNAQYEEFLAVEFSEAYLAELMPAACDWKVDFTPTNFPNNPIPSYPVVNVDWCDAYAYCAWSGKHLCGKVGGGPAALSEVQNPSNNEWYRACSQGGIKNYPYGLMYDGNNCNTVDAGVGQVWPVGSADTCEGGYPGVYDMSGNVWEWSNACDNDDQLPTNEQLCRRRGGSYFSDGPTSRCGINSTRPRDYRNSNQGFRCCADG